MGTWEALAVCGYQLVPWPSRSMCRPAVFQLTTELLGSIGQGPCLSPKEGKLQCSFMESSYLSLCWVWKLQEERGGSWPESLDILTVPGL